MRPLRLCPTLLAACLATAVPSAAELLFHVPFDDSLDATVAGGDGTGKYSPPKSAPGSKPVFADGLHGKALDIGNLSRVTYDPTGNVLDERGTITFWARRAGPESEDRYTYHLMGWSNTDGTWVYVYRWQWFPSVTMLHGKGGSGDVGVRVPRASDDGAWHFFAFTWDGTSVRAYLDGETDSAGEKADYPPQQFASLWVGSHGGTECSRLIDELRIFDQPLAVAEIRQMYRREAGVTTEPTLTVPRRRVAIKIDGALSDGEWDDAAETTGFIGLDSKLVAPTQTNARLAYDDEALYVCLTSRLPEAVRNNPAMTTGITGALRQTCDRFDAGVDQDDAVELNVMPELPNGMWYRLVVNALNTHYDYSMSPEDNIALDWNPQWESASTLDSDGWHVEVRLPFASFGAPPPKPGDKWGLNLIRIWQTLQSGREAWKCGKDGRPGYRYSVAPIEFGADDAPVVRLSDWGPLSDNLVRIDGEVRNPGDAPKTIEVAVTSDSGEIEETQDIHVAAKSRKPFRFAGRIQAPATGLLALSVTEADQPLLRSEVPVMVRQVLEINTAHFPTAGILKVMVDAGRLRESPLSELSLQIALQDEDGKAALPAVRVQPLPDYRCEAEVNVKPLEPGDYQAKCVVSRNGEPVGERLVAYEKRPLPEWYGNAIGTTDKAPKPFTPVRRDGDTVRCWGREIRYDGRLLPVQIATQGEEMLAGPIELVLTDGSGRSTGSNRSYRSSAVGAEASWGNHTDFRLEYQRRCTLGNVPIETSCWIECDGFLWTTLRLSACGETVNHLSVRVPLKKEWSEYLNPYDYSTAKTGKLEPEGYACGATPLWLGSPVGGLQWTTETLQPCRLKEDTLPVRVIPGEDANVFELTLIDVPTKLDEPFEVSWGWVATPTRPKTPGYRGWLTKNCDLYPGYQWYWPKGTDMDPRWLGYSHFIGKKNRPDGKGQYTVSGGPYAVTGLCPENLPEFQYWGDEWSPSRMGRRTEDHRGIVSVGAKSWVDYFVWCYRQTYDRGRYLGLYYDCAPYYPDDNVYHGAGYRDGDQILPTNPVLSAREIAKRMYCMLRELEPEQTMVLYHNSGQLDMAFLSWCDVYVDGENFTSRLSKKEQDYHRVYPPDAFLAQSMGHNFGPAVWFLDEFNRSKATDEEDWKRLGVQPVTHLYGLILLHDSGYWKAYGIQQGYDMVDEALRKYSFDDRYRMIPYWNQQIVKLPDKVFATFYRDDQANRVLMVLLNNNEEDLALRLKMDWQALGFDDPGRLTVDDAVFKEGAAIEGGELVTPVGRANMRLLAIEPK